MSSTLFKHVWNELKIGHLQRAHEYILKKEMHPITGDNALKVLICIVQGLNSTNDSPLYLVGTIHMLEFEVLNGSNLADYLSCMFHIVKYIISLKDFDLIIQLESYIIPPFLGKVKLENKHVTYLKWLCSILHNNFLEILNNLKNHDTNLVFTNCKLLIRLSVNATENFLPRIQSYISSLLYLEYDSDKILELYKYLYLLIECKELGESKENFKSLMVLLLKICKHFVVKEEYGSILDYVIMSKNKLIESAGKNGGFITRVLTVSPLFTTLNMYPDTTVDILNNFTEVLIEASQSCELKFYIDLMVPLITILLDEAIKASQDDDIKKLVNISFARTFFKTTDALEKLSSAIEFKCCCGIKYDIYTMLKAVTIKSILMKHLIVFERFDDDLHATVIKHFTHCFGMLVLLQKKNCTMLNSQWRHSGSILYNIATKLYHMKDKACVRYLKLFSKATLEIEGVENSLIQENITNKTLQSLVEILIANEYYQNGLQVSALNIFLYPKGSKWSLQQWSKCKCALGEQFKNVTVVSVLNDNEAYLKTYYEGFEKVTDRNIILELLFLELNTYKKYWPISVYGLLCELKKHADYVMLGKEIMSVEYFDIIKFDRNILKELIQPCIKHIESLSRDQELHLLLGYLYFLYFKFSFLDLMDNNDKDLNSTILPPKPEQLEPIDINNECDINPSYQYLAISTCNKKFQYLNKSLESLQDGIQSGIKDSSLINKNLFNLCLQLAYEFKLHCDTLHFLKAMCITLEFARVLKDEGLVIRTIAGIMEYLDVDSKKFQSFKVECDSIIARVENLDLKIYCRYYTSLSLAYMKCDQFKKCNEMYEKASDYYYKFQNDTNTELDSKIVKLYYLYLEALLANTACMHSISNHDSLALSRLHSTYQLITLSLKTVKKLSPEFLSISMDAMENILNFYVSMRLPREVRCFGRGVYDLTQELVLPFRVVRLTIYLAKADLLSCRFADCDVKLEKLSNILGLDKKVNTWKENEDLCEIANKVEALCLENPSMNRMTSAYSPKLYTTKFKPPSFIRHELTCNCFPCSSIEYKDSVMQKIHLDALLSAAHDDSKSALEFYKGVTSIYEHISKAPIETLEDVSLNMQFYTSTYNQFMLDYIRYYVKEGECETAIALNTQLLKKMRLEINKSFHLYNEVLKLHWILTYGCSEVVQDEHEETPEFNIEEIKTPERKISERTIKRTPSPVVLSPHAKLALKSKDLRIKSPVIEYKTPAFLVPKTPAPIFKIFTPETSSMKKPMNSTRKMVRKNLCNDLEGTVPNKKVTDKAKKTGLKIFCDESDGEEKLKKPTPRSTRKTLAQKLVERHESINPMTPESGSSDNEDRLAHPELINSAKKNSNQIKKTILKSTLSSDNETNFNEINKSTPSRFQAANMKTVLSDKKLKKPEDFKSVTNQLKQIKKPAPRSAKKTLTQKCSDIQELSNPLISKSASKGAVRKYTRKKETIDNLQLEEHDVSDQSTKTDIFDKLKSSADVPTGNNIFDAIKSPTENDVFDLKESTGDAFDILKSSNEPTQDIFDYESNSDEQTQQDTFGTFKKSANDIFDNNQQLQKISTSSKKISSNLIKKSKPATYGSKKLNGKLKQKETDNDLNSNDDLKKNTIPNTLQDMENELEHFKSLRINILDIESVKSAPKRIVTKNIKEKDMPLKEMQTDEVPNLRSLRKKLNEDMNDAAEKKSASLKNLDDSKGGNEVKVKRTTRRIIK